MKNQKAPGPKQSFLLGSLAPVSKDVNQFLLGTYRDFTDIAAFRLAHQRCYLVSEPDYIKTVLVTDHKSYHKDRFFWKHTRPLLGMSVLTDDGESWRNKRRLIAPAFQPKTLSHYVNDIQALTQKWIDEKEANQQLDMGSAMADLTSKVIVKALFGTNLQETGETISSAVKDTTEIVYKRMRQVISMPFFVPTRDNRTYMNAVRQLDKIVYGFIDEHRASSNTKDTLLAALMGAKNEDGTSFSDSQLRNEAITLFLAGHETTSLMMTWTWYLLSQNPNVSNKLRTELNSVLGGRAPGLEDLDKLPYTNAVLKESLRLYPPAFLFTREAIKKTNIGPFKIPKRSLIFISTWALNRNEYYFSDPETFRPERWTQEFEKSLPKYLFIPFSSGPRVCVGERFAMAEAVIMLAMIAQNFTFDYLADSPPVPFAGITLRPKDGMPMSTQDARQETLPAHGYMAIPMDLENSQAEQIT